MNHFNINMSYIKRYGSNNNRKIYGNYWRRTIVKYPGS